MTLTVWVQLFKSTRIRVLFFILVLLIIIGIGISVLTHQESDIDQVRNEPVHSESNKENTPKTESMSGSMFSSINSTANESTLKVLDSFMNLMFLVLPLIIIISVLLQIFRYIDL